MAGYSVAKILMPKMVTGFRKKTISKVGLPQNEKSHKKENDFKKNSRVWHFVKILCKVPAIHNDILQQGRDSGLIWHWAFEEQWKWRIRKRWIEDTEYEGNVWNFEQKTIRIRRIAGWKSPLRVTRGISWSVIFRDGTMFPFCGNRLCRSWSVYCNPREHHAPGSEWFASGI